MFDRDARSCDLAAVTPTFIPTFPAPLWVRADFSSVRFASCLPDEAIEHLLLPRGTAPRRLAAVLAEASRSQFGTAATPSRVSARRVVAHTALQRWVLTRRDACCASPLAPWSGVGPSV